MVLKAHTEPADYSAQVACCAYPQPVRAARGAKMMSCFMSIWLHSCPRLLNCLYARLVSQAQVSAEAKLQMWAGALS